jgi:hypothetical protein
MKHCAPRDPQRVPKPKYEATALCSHQSIGYPNSTNGQYHHTTALLTGEVTSETLMLQPRYVCHDMFLVDSLLKNSNFLGSLLFVSDECRT